MPYLFPHEDLFVAGVGVLIVGLLVLRLRLAGRRRMSSDEPATGAGRDEAEPGRPGD